MASSHSNKPERAEILREYGPFEGSTHAHGVTFDGERAWFAAGTHLQSFDPESGTPGPRLETPADAGTAFDGHHPFQITGAVINKIDAKTGRVLATIPAPGKGRDSGLAWAEGKLWVGQYGERRILCIDPDTGDVLRSIASDRFVTGVTFVEGELWHGTWEDEQSELRRVDPESGKVLERLEMPPGVTLAGLESDGADGFFCGGGASGTVRRVRRA